MRRTPANKVGEPLLRQALAMHDLGGVRTLLRDWATGADLDADTVDAITLSGYEAVVNSVEHGYPDKGGGVVELYAERTDGQVTITVIDHGAWQVPSESPDRGRGLMLIRGLSDHTAVTSTDTGTTVTMTWLR